MALIGVPLLLVAAFVGGVRGWLVGARYPLYPTEDQQAQLDSAGEPSAFILSDGPVKPGDRVLRVETWIYGDTGEQVTFLAGQLLSRGTASNVPQAEATQVSPWTLERSMTLADVERVLGEKAVPLENFQSAYDDSEGFVFERNRLQVSTLDDHFFTASTY